LLVLEQGSFFFQTFLLLLAHLLQQCFQLALRQQSLLLIVFAVIPLTSSVTAHAFFC
jgi:hypothetical protein